LRTAQSAGYLIYSEADFKVFGPAAATRFTDEGEIWHGGAKFHPHRCNDKGIGPPKLKLLLIFDKKNVEYKRPTEAYPCAILTKFTEFVPFQNALAIRDSLDLLKGLWSYGGFNLTGSRYPKIFSAP